LAFVLVVIAALIALYWLIVAGAGGAEGWAMRGSLAP